MGLNWNEINSTALLFSKTWADASHEDSEAKPFWIDFFEIFGITNKRVSFDAAYQPSGGKKFYASHAKRMSFMFDLYQRITSLLPATAAKKKRKPKVTEG